MSNEAELKELQEVLGTDTPIRRPSKYLPDVLASSSGETPSDPKSKSETELTQWAVLANGRYAAAGMTQQRLPVGAYVLQSTQTGIFFEAQTILTDTLIDLGNSNSLKVIEGIQLFWKRRQKYVDRGILFKRGILMWGPPGSGKTATLALLVKNLIEMGGIVLLVQHPSLAVAGLRQLRKIERTRPLIVVLEDVEEIISQFGEHDLLALLDGEHQTDNVVNIATTNYPEQLGARIINRPSRFDEVVKIGMPSPEMREQYLWHLLKDEHAKYPVAQWVRQTEGMSIAHLKELVVAVTCLEQPYEEVISRLKTMKTTPRSSMYDTLKGFTGGLTATEAAMQPSRG